MCVVSLKCVHVCYREREQRERGNTKTMLLYLPEVGGKMGAEEDDGRSLRDGVCFQGNPPPSQCTSESGPPVSKCSSFSARSGGEEDEEDEEEEEKRPNRFSG